MPILVAEVAKAAKDSDVEVVRSADLIDYTAEEGIRVLAEGKFLVSDAFPGNERNKLCMSSKVPLGVILAIPPFNYPVNLCVSKIGPALMAGNSVVIKTPTQGAVSCLHMIQCFHKAGVPKGLLSAVTGRGSDIGDYLTTHPLVQGISFTGGDTGLDIAKKAGMIPLQMELGGKDACIVLSDADLTLAAANIIKGGFSYSGQRCTAVKVVLVEETVADKLVELVNAGIAKLSVGKAAENKDITAVVSSTSADFIEGLVLDAKHKGAKLHQEYKREGNLIWPVLIDNVTVDMRIAWEEPFGPVIPVIRVKSEDEALAIANKSRYGLQGCVFTKDIDRAIRVADQLETGTVQINSAPARGPDHFPFQGVKNSGISSQGITNSIHMITKTKTTVINLLKARPGAGSRLSGCCLARHASLTAPLLPALSSSSPPAVLHNRGLKVASPLAGIPRWCGRHLVEAARRRHFKFVAVPWPCGAYACCCYARACLRRVLQYGPGARRHSVCVDD